MRCVGPARGGMLRGGIVCMRLLGRHLLLGGGGGVLAVMDVAPDAGAKEPLPIGELSWLGGPLLRACYAAWDGRSAIQCRVPRNRVLGVWARVVVGSGGRQLGQACVGGGGRRRGPAKRGWRG
jgi:hypothetical protein